jgi:lysyl-tRNA synthetase class 1
MLKRFVGTRTLSESDIPIYMDEVDKLEKIYFGEEKAKEENRLPNIKRLFEYVHFLNPPKIPTLKIPYNVLVNIVKVLPLDFEKKFEISKNILTQSKHIKTLSKEDEEELKERINYATNWLEVMGEELKAVSMDLNDNEKKALKELKDILSEDLKAEEIQIKLFEVAKRHNVQVPRFFEIIYMITLGIERGPRAGQLIFMIGRENTIRMIDKMI